jgi:hypothetical protein
MQKNPLQFRDLAHATTLNSQTYPQELWMKSNGLCRNAANTARLGQNPPEVPALARVLRKTHAWMRAARWLRLAFVQRVRPGAHD